VFEGNLYENILGKVLTEMVIGGTLSSLWGVGKGTKSVAIRRIIGNFATFVGRIQWLHS